ncbi:MAG: twin-arginine translocase TatA/TatE family subunit, partial [Polyangiaceae bacterium]|nr:twin-arginine translocase TatA/TatE family subunit [Polyangiaceae bacterium]
MGPTPLQIMIVVGIALLLFAAGRIADVGKGPRRT